MSDPTTQTPTPAKPDLAALAKQCEEAAARGEKPVLEWGNRIDEATEEGEFNQVIRTRN